MNGGGGGGAGELGTASASLPKTATSVYIGHFHSSAHYVRLYEQAKQAYAAYKRSPSVTVYDRFLQTLRTTLRLVAQLLDAALGVHEVGTHLDELLLYLRVTFQVEPSASIKCVTMCLKTLFNLNLAGLMHDYAQQQVGTTLARLAAAHHQPPQLSLSFSSQATTSTSQSTSTQASTTAQAKLQHRHGSISSLSSLGSIGSPSHQHRYGANRGGEQQTAVNGLFSLLISGPMTRVKRQLVPGVTATATANAAAASVQMQSAHNTSSINMILVFDCLFSKRSLDLKLELNCVDYNYIIIEIFRKIPLCIVYKTPVL